MLGTPLDAHFQTIQSGGTTIFPGAPITGLQADDFKHEKIEIHDTTTFDANVSAWGGAFGMRAGMGSSSESRFASYRAYDVHFVSVVDDRYPHSSPPPYAVWYPARIYWGHSYEVVCSGNAYTTSANLEAKIKIFSGNFSASDGQDGINCKLTGRGLQPKKRGAIFAASDGEVRASYDDFGAPPSPVFVEYRLIPGISPPPPGTINWLSQLSVEVRYDSIHIDSQSNLLSVAYHAQGFCKLDGQNVPGSLMPAVNGDSGKGGTNLSTSWAASFQASPGQKISCGLQGNFHGAWHSGSMPTASMADFAITAAGTFPGSFHGSNGDTQYTVNYTVSVRSQ